MNNRRVSLIGITMISSLKMNVTRIQSYWSGTAQYEISIGSTDPLWWDRNQEKFDSFTFTVSKDVYFLEPRSKLIRMRHQFLDLRSRHDEQFA